MEQAAGLGTDLRDGRAGGVVDLDVEGREGRRGVEQVGPLVVLDAGTADVGERHAGLRRKQALGDFDLAHLEREENDRGPRAGGVGAEVEGEARLAHAGSGSDNDHLAGAHALQGVVDAGVTRLDAKLALSRLGHLAELLVEVLHDGGERGGIVLDVPAGDVEDLLLGEVDDVARVLGRVEGHRLDAGRGRDELAQGCVTTEHLDVMAPAGKGE